MKLKNMPCQKCGTDTLHKGYSCLTCGTSNVPLSRDLRVALGKRHWRAMRRTQRERQEGRDRLVREGIAPDRLGPRAFNQLRTTFGSGHRSPNNKTS